MKKLFFAMAAVVLSSSVTHARDVICVTLRTETMFSLKFDQNLTKVSAIEGETDVVLDQRLSTTVSGKKISVIADLGRSGEVDIQLKQSSETERFFLYTGTALINIFGQDDVRTKGVEKVECYTNK